MGSAGQISLVFQFNTDFTDTNRLLNLALNPHLLYTLLVAVCIIYIYFENICKKSIVYPNIGCIFVEPIR